jgi:protein-S-isoprenylcysteine O-methyltransferase Ste14
MHRALLLVSRVLGLGDQGIPNRRLLADRVLPGLFFGVLAMASCSGALSSARRGPIDPSFSAKVAYVLDVAHPLLTSLFCGLIASLFLIRSIPRSDRARPPVLAVAFAGTFVMGAVAAQPPTTHDWRVLALSDALLLGGLAFATYAVASLRSSFGLAPEARELVTSGAYRLVRHPIYLGELVAATGALLPVVAPLTTLIFAMFCLCQFVRAVLEERVLSAAFPQYEDYRRRTPGLVPWPRL